MNDVCKKFLVEAKGNDGSAWGHSRRIPPIFPPPKKKDEMPDHFCSKKHSQLNWTHLSFFLLFPFWVNVDFEKTLYGGPKNQLSVGAYNYNCRGEITPVKPINFRPVIGALNLYQSLTIGERGPPCPDGAYVPSTLGERRQPRWIQPIGVRSTKR